MGKAYTSTSVSPSVPQFPPIYRIQGSPQQLLETIFQNSGFEWGGPERPTVWSRESSSLRQGGGGEGGRGWWSSWLADGISDCISGGGCVEQANEALWPQKAELCGAGPVGGWQPQGEIPVGHLAELALGVHKEEKELGCKQTAGGPHSHGSPRPVLSF